MTRDDFRRRADLVREIPLEAVLRSWDAVRDERDKSRWQTQRGPLSVTRGKFFNWHASQGGGGAIDLVMHLSSCSVRQAIEWLWHHYGGGQVTGRNPATASDATSALSPRRSLKSHHDSTLHGSAPQQLRLPASSRANLERVRRYLRKQRCLSAEILTSLIDDGKLYADGRGNAVFLMVAGKPNRPIGAELRGTGKQVWRGLAPGTRRNAGYFWVGNAGSKVIVLCESAIDAISCLQLHTTQLDGTQLRGNPICISTAGVRSTAPWLDPLMARGYTIYCGFDRDEPGESASRQMIARHPSIQRLRPPRHDWNDALTSRRS